MVEESDENSDETDENRVHPIKWMPVLIFCNIVKAYHSKLKQANPFESSNHRKMSGIKQVNA